MAGISYIALFGLLACIFQNANSQAIGVANGVGCGNGIGLNGLTIGNPGNNLGALNFGAIGNVANLGNLANAANLANGNFANAANLANGNFANAANLANGNLGLIGANAGSSAIGYGDVALAGELPVGGSTAVTGNVPVIGYVTFEGTVPAGGIVSVASNCCCNSK